MKVDFIDCMGTDLTVVNAARVSFDKESEWATDYPDWGPVFHLREQDQKLIKYLATHNHWSPFSHVMITMRETVPIFVARQRFKHMVGFTYNEVSRRYVDDVPEFFTPESWRKAAENKKQGSSDEIVKGPLSGGYAGSDYLDYDDVIQICKLWYEAAIKAGVAPEQARMVLPQSMYTSYYTTGSLAAWVRAYKLRSDDHSQKEIRDLAAQWDQIISNIPELKYSWQALKN